MSRGETVSGIYGILVVMYLNELMLLLWVVQCHRGVVMHHITADCIGNSLFHQRGVNRRHRDMCTQDKKVRGSSKIS